jgi:hypothetical protein
MKRRWIAGLMAVVCVGAMAVFTGCTGGSNEGDAEATSYMLTLAFVNEQYVQTGNDALDVIIDTKMEKRFPNEREMYLQTLELLREENIINVSVEGDVKLTTAFASNFNINDVTVSDGIATVDFDGEDFSGSSTQETMLISQIVETLTKSFDTIKGVDFTVNGEKVETLLGHVDASTIFTQSLYK